MKDIQVVCTHVASLVPDVAAHLIVTLAQGEDEKYTEWFSFAKLINGREGLAWCIGLTRPGSDYYSTLYEGTLSQEEARKKATHALLMILPLNYTPPDVTPRRNMSAAPQYEPFF